VRNGIITLAGQLGSAEQHGLIRIAVRLTWNIDGAVDVVNKVGVSTTPSIPAPDLPYNDTRLNPKEFVANACDLLSGCSPPSGGSLRRWVELTKPLFGRAGAQAWRRAAISRRMSGVKISCMASSIFPPGTTMMFGRDMNESCSIDSR